MDDVGVARGCGRRPDAVWVDHQVALMGSLAPFVSDLY
jgi:hypothetical protein